MRISKAIAGFAVTLTLLLPAKHGTAQSFIGASLGQSNVDHDIARGLITSGSVDGKDTAFKLFSGYMFGRHFGLEGAYVDLGDVSYSGSFSGTPVTGGKVELKGYNIAAMLSYPMSEEFSLFGKLGIFLWELRASDTTGGQPFSSSNRGRDVSFGLGAGYNLGRHLAVRAEWERFKLDDVGADLLSAGLVWRF
jgi:OmpA-OmpF porin, OOP family